MIKKLRVKLIAASMLSLLLVLFVIGGAVSVLNYGKVVSDADRILAVLEENKGKFPSDFPTEKIGKPQTSQNGKEHVFSPEVPYESRYFSVVMDKEGNIISTDTGKVVSVGNSAAAAYAKNVWKSGKERGFEEDYRYRVCSYGTKTRIIFLDWGRNLSAFHDFLLTLAGVSAIGLLAVFVLLIFLSSRIVKPFSENYEKQKRFITDAGHELKTPLTIIDADAELLEMDYGKSEWVSDIRNQTKRLADLTNQLILLSRMEEAAKKEMAVVFPLSDVAEEVTSEFLAPAKAQNKTITSHIEPMISMKGDEAAVRRLIVILLDNALKYADKNGTIRVSLEKQKNEIRLSVYNTTDFIAREDLKNLFDRFYRTDRSRNSDAGGYGLGLSIAAAIVNKQKGKISAYTEDETSLQINVTFTRQSFS